MRTGWPTRRCVALLSRQRSPGEYGPQARDGSGRLAEVYPAASLKLWGLPTRGYKGRGAPETERLAVALAALSAAAPWLDLAGHDDRLPPPMTCSNALIASLTGRAAALGRTLRPDGGHRQDLP